MCMGVQSPRFEGMIKISQAWQQASKPTVSKWWKGKERGSGGVKRGSSSKLDPGSLSFSVSNGHLHDVTSIGQRWAKMVKEGQLMQ